MKGIKKALSYITNVEYAIMVVTFVAMVIAYFISVVNRNFIKASMPWTEEVAMYSMIYCSDRKTPRSYKKDRIYY